MLVPPLSKAFDTGRAEGGVHHVMLLCEISREIGTSFLASAFLPKQCRMIFLVLQVSLQSFGDRRVVCDGLFAEFSGRPKNILGVNTNCPHGGTDPLALAHIAIHSASTCTHMHMLASPQDIFVYL